MSLSFRKIGSLLLSLTLVLSLALSLTFPSSHKAAHAVSAGPVILIASASDLELLRSNPDGYYRLANDLTLSGSFVPIPEFRGTLDGNGHTISNLSITASSAQPKAAFIVVNYGMIKHIGFKSVAITGLSTNSTYWAGGIAGTNRGVIQESFVTGVVSGGYRSAGIAVTNYGVVHQVYSTAQVNAEVEGGGLVAVSESGSLLSGSYVKPNVYSQQNNTGGITAYAYTGAIIRNNAVLAGTISNGSGSNVARIAGRLNGTPTFAGNIASSQALVQGAVVTGGTAGNNQGLSVTNAELAGQAVYEGTPAWNFSSVWQWSAVLARPMLREVQESRPLQLASAADLAQLRTNPSGDFELTADVTLTGSFTPIATFNGTLNGNGHRISNLTIAASTSQPKAAFIVENNGVVERLGIVNATITGLSTNSTYWAGGLVAANHGIVQESYVTGTVTGGFRSAGVAVTNYGIVRNVHASAEVSAQVESGGLVAVSESGSVLASSYVVPDVHSVTNNTGGLTAYAYTGAVIRDNAVLAGTITNGGTNNIARVVGRQNGTPTLQNNIASPNALVQGGTVTGGTATNAQGLTVTAASLFKMPAYEDTLGWDLYAVWEMSAQLARPILRHAQENRDILISTPAGLEQLRTNPSGDFKLANNLVMSGVFEPIPNFTGTLDGDGYHIYGLTVVARANLPKVGFVVENNGVIERLGLVEVAIAGRKGSSAEWAGGVTASNRGVIREVFVTGVVTGGYRSGGIAAHNYSTIRNSYSDLIVKGRVESGALVGVSESGSLLATSYAAPNVHSEVNNTGGLSGYAYANAVIRDNVLLSGSISNGANSTIARIAGRLNGTPTFQNNRASQQALVQGVVVSGGTLANAQGLSVSDTVLRNQALYEDAQGWDFTSIWEMDPQLGRPVLQIAEPALEAAAHPILYRVYRDETVVLSAGVTHRQMDFIDVNGHIQKANIIDANLNLPQNKIIVGTKNNVIPPTDENGDYIRILDENGSDAIRGTVAEQAATTVLPGRQVIAGVNGEFYTEQGPEGYMIKDGSSIINGVRVPGADGKNYPFHGFLGIKDDGTAIIGNYSDDWEQEKDNLFQASGGQYWMVKDGIPQNFNGLVISDSNHPDFDYETYYRHKDRHPRTAAGIRSDGSVFFVVVDGRGANSAVGMYIEELGLYMEELGAYQALNMDGGGSSTAVTRNSITGAYDVKNTPINNVNGVSTPGAARRVFSSLLIVVDEAS